MKAYLLFPLGADANSPLCQGEARPRHGDLRDAFPTRMLYFSASKLLFPPWNTGSQEQPQFPPGKWKHVYWGVLRLSLMRAPSSEVLVCWSHGSLGVVAWLQAGPALPGPKASGGSHSHSPPARPLQARGCLLGQLPPLLSFRHRHGDLGLALKPAHPERQKLRGVGGGGRGAAERM